ncbi:hypothetical protein L484_000255 [Morus notabilis]|uniref:Uncharacterized protein n=1 Tax=Morus notabilis TaxID=981085 RepID=W9SM39_9ROSA|nr:hypothetical protein L484_000255 [Morus notabilis]
MILNNTFCAYVMHNVFFTLASQALQLGVGMIRSTLRVHLGSEEDVGGRRGVDWDGSGEDDGGNEGGMREEVTVLEKEE